MWTLTKVFVTAQELYPCVENLWTSGARIASRRREPSDLPLLFFPLRDSRSRESGTPKSSTKRPEASAHLRRRNVLPWCRTSCIHIGQCYREAASNSANIADSFNNYGKLSKSGRKSRRKQAGTRPPLPSHSPAANHLPLFRRLRRRSRSVGVGTT